MPNPWTEFRKLLPSDPLLSGTVQAHNADGTSTLETPEGNLVRVSGQSVEIGGRAFYQSGRVQGEAPDLPTYDATV